jgi:hypothetical protein
MIDDDAPRLLRLMNPLQSTIKNDSTVPLERIDLERSNKDCGEECKVVAKVIRART